MGELVVTSSQVQNSGGQTTTRNAAAAVTAGQAVYINANNLVALAQCDGTVLEAAAIGVALNSAATGQPVSYAASGDIVIGAAAAVVVGQAYCVGRTPGAICLHSDLLQTDYVTVIGFCKAATKITISINQLGVQKP